MYIRNYQKELLRKLTALLLIFALLGAAPGTSEIFAANAQTPFTEQKVKIDGDNPLAVSTDSESKADAEIASSDKELEKELAETKKREMSRAEEIAWNVAKALIPTLAVMSFSAAVVCPLAWVVIGAVAVGATAAGLMTLAYELRKNSFRSEEEKKEMDKIWRDVTIAAAVNGAMAPFSMLTAGIAQAIGPVTVKTIAQTAAKAGVVSFLGSTVSNVTKGSVINLWYDHYYNYDEKEKALKLRIETLHKIKNRTPEQEKLLVECLKELDTISKEKYTWESFRKDEHKALVSAGITGILGGAAAKLGAEQGWAKIASSKLFGSTDKAAMVSNAVISNPFAFATGTGIAAIDKKEILNQIKYNRVLQSKYEKDSPAWKYYEEKIADLEEAYKNTSLVEAGKNAMINNAAMQTAVVGTSLARTRIWDLPSQKRTKIQEKFESENPEYQKANAIRHELELKRAKQPVLSDFKTKREYSAALKDYAKDLSQLRTEYQKALVVASNAQKQPENKARIAEITKEVNQEIEYARQTELAKSLGTESYLKFKIKELEGKKEYLHLSEEELRDRADFEIRQEFSAAAADNAKRLEYLEAKMKRTDLDLHGDIERGNDGKLYVVIRDANGNYVRQRPYEGGEGAYWFDKLTKSSPAELKEAEINRLLKEAYNSASMVKPSQIRNEYVNMKINGLRAQGMNDEQIDQQLGTIVADANKRMLSSYGSWQNATKAEILATGLERAKYDDGASPGMKKILEFLEAELSNKTINAFQLQLREGVKAVIPDKIPLRILPTDSAKIDAATEAAVNSNSRFRNR